LSDGYINLATGTTVENGTVINEISKIGSQKVVQ
ncbi:unnamed protein product, partial [marine sediment metagenome]